MIVEIAFHRGWVLLWMHAPFDMLWTENRMLLSCCPVDGNLMLRNENYVGTSFFLKEIIVNNLTKITFLCQISGQDRQEKSSASLLVATPSTVSSAKPRQYHKNTEPYSQSPRLSASCRFSDNKINYPEGETWFSVSLICAFCLWLEWLRFGFGFLLEPFFRG